MDLVTCANNHVVGAFLNPARYMRLNYLIFGYSTKLCSQKYFEGILDLTQIGLVA